MLFINESLRKQNVLNVSMKYERLENIAKFKYMSYYFTKKLIYEIEINTHSLKII